jgi:predicted ATPase/class 3 adenylate cyclase
MMGGEKGPGQMPELPNGTVTFLFTDVEGSTRMWEENPNAMRPALARHDALIEAAVARQGGVLVRPRGEGDSRFAVFARATDAVAAAGMLQQSLHAERWPAESSLRVRVALHTGEADLREGDYYGSAVNRCARLRAIAHGGQTLLSQAAHDLVRDHLPPALTLADLGEHRLADLQRAERVYQLLAEGVPADFPPLRSLTGIPNNLPLELTSFVGRAAEVAAVSTLLVETRMLTLVGTGGVGKTRLALRVAAEALSEFADGVWLVELASLSDPALVPQAVTAAMNRREDPDRTPLASLVAAVAQRRLLLLLDNCEHLIDACAGLTEALLRACPHLRILATSREALSSGGEVAWRVPSLSLPDPDRGDPVEMTACDAVRLFVERARVARPGFEVTAANRAAVAQVCRRLDGIPLALELAAARLRGLSLEELAARLDERFRLLTGGRRTALPRQQTLQATVEWSYGLLEERERLLFDRLSVFAGSFSLASVEAVCAGGDISEPEVLELLLLLVDKSLVVAQDGGVGTTRYRLLETLSQYGRERLAERADAAAVRERHAEYFASLDEVSVERFWGPEQRATLERLHAESQDLLAALDWFLEGGAPAQALRLLVPLEIAGIFARTTGGRALVTRLLSAPALQAPGPERAQALRWAGTWLCFSGDAGGFDLLEEALALARRCDALPVLGETLYWLGECRFDPWGDPEGARPLLEEALALIRSLDNRAYTILCLLLLGQVVVALGDQERAEALAREALALSRAAGDAHGEAYAHEVLGEVAAARGEEADAERLWTGCLATYRAMGHSGAIATVAGDLGRLALRRGRPAEARGHFVAALEALRGPETGWLVWGLSELAGLALVAALEGKGEPAVRLAGAATAAYTVRGIRLLPADREALDQAVALASLDAPTETESWAEGRAMTLEQAVAYALDEFAR